MTICSQKLFIAMQITNKRFKCFTFSIFVFLILQNQLNAQTDSSSNLKKDTSGKSAYLVVNPLIACSISGTNPVTQGSSVTYNLICDQTATSWTVTCGTKTYSDNVSATISWNGTSCTTGTITAKNGSTILASKTITINFPPLAPGTVAPPAQTINYGDVPYILSSVGVSGGNSTYSYQWQSSINGTTWGNIGTNSPNYSSSSLITTTFFRVLVSSNGSTLPSTNATVNVYPAIQGGTVSSSSAIANYAGTAIVLTSIGVAGGSGIYSYQWQQAVDGVGYTDIQGANSTTYSTSLINKTYFRVKISSNGANAYSSSTSVDVNPQLFPGTISPSVNVVSSGNSPGTLTANVAQGGTCSGIFNYQWQKSNDGLIFSDISGASTQNYTPSALTIQTYFRRRVICGTDTGYTNRILVYIGSTTIPLNFIRTREITKPGVLDLASAALLTDVNDVKQSSQYFDGLGRLVQTVTMKISPSGKDMVSMNLYDEFGRENVELLPFSSNSTDGNFKTTAFSDQTNFNSNGSYFSGEQFYYNQIDFESSPENTPIKSYSPGLNWIGVSKGISQDFNVNLIADSVRLWTISQTPGSIPVTTSNYLPGKLYKTISIDENNHQNIEYKDFEGKIVLKRVQLSNVPGSAHVGWLNTYYVYDDLNNLRYVFQPKAVDLMLAAGAWSPSSIPNLTNELCFRYEYDSRSRMIVKQVPGVGDVYMIYDARDRVVMSQDANLAIIGKWQVNIFDSQNRHIATGLLTDANSRSFHQNLAYYSISYPSTAVNFELLLQNFYDDYGWAAGQGLLSSLNNIYTSNNTYFNTNYNSFPIYAQPINQFLITRGMLTGISKKIIGSGNQFLPSVFFYDDRGRIVETQDVNQTSAKDTIINQYDFSGKLIRNLVRHQNGKSPIQFHSVLTKRNYDGMGRLMTLYKNIDNAAVDQLINTNTYNELGQVVNKQLGNNLDNLSYAFNIRGWLTTINKQFLVGTSGNYFGMELGYDKIVSVASTSYLVAQYNGNITGTVWKTAGDGVGRKYDFVYDNVNRLTGADFNQNSGSAFDKTAGIDFSVSGLQYDGNGNILSMKQRGFKVGGSATIDSLSYIYQLNSNKLSIVNDGVNDATSKLGDFHFAGTKQPTDYNYDVNGNLTLDNNKAISSIAYNFLNLPQAITITSKGTITYTYDASGTKLYKTTVDNTISPSKTTTTTYIGGFVYQATSPSTGGPVAADTLQFIAHEEGRARWAFHKTVQTGTVWYGFEYDFFEKDHLGNTRVVLTQQKDTALYLASGESAYRTTENQLFTNLTTTAVARTSAPNYPNDLTITNPNDTVFKVSGDVGSHKTGPSLLLKVMSGDKIDLSVQYFYNTGVNSTQNSSVTDVLASLASGIVNIASGGKGSMTDLNNTSGSPLYNALNNFMSNDPNPTGKPKAYLNWILLDEQLKYVSSFPQSGALAASTSGVLTTLANTGIPITKSGYLYIWVSNETVGWNVFFDNLKVAHYAGPLLEETHYYPFGLTMAGISSKALKTKYAQNNFKYGNKELQNLEFSDGTGLENYDFDTRNYDPQIGRWNQIDPLSEASRMWAPYNYTYDNPLRYIDPDGMLSYDWKKKGYVDDNGKDVKLDDALNQLSSMGDKIYEVTPHEESENENDNQGPASGQPISFLSLWNNYPSEHIKHTDNKTKKELYENQCAILLGEALLASGIKLKGYSGSTCRDCSKNEQHPLSAEQLANWLQHAHIKGLTKGKELTGANYYEYVKGKTGIIYFQDYWPRPGESRDKGPRTGDHIDLWNENKLASLGLTLTFLRRNIPGLFEHFFDTSDYSRSVKVIFWEIKK
jgi:RHS repeat-associated protein